MAKKPKYKPLEDDAFGREVTIYAICPKILLSNIEKANM